MRNDMFERLLIVLLLAILLGTDLITGCSSNTPDNLQSFDATPAGRLYEFTLKDGTPCVYLARGSQGGLSCNWGNK